MPRYFDKKGNPLKLLDWGRLFEDETYRVVKQEKAGRYVVRTVWTGIDLSPWIFPHNKMIFETMISLKNRDDKRAVMLDPVDEYQERYSTEEEALLGHEKAVKIARGEIYLYQDKKDPTREYKKEPTHE